jgi:hypothetical protein
MECRSTLNRSGAQGQFVKVRADENLPRHFRTFGVLRHTFPEMTRAEKQFLVLTVFCLGLLALLLYHKPPTRTESTVQASCAGVGASVLAYWMKQEPEALLQFLLFPYTGWRADGRDLDFGCHTLHASCEGAVFEFFLLKTCAVISSERCTYKFTIDKTQDLRYAFAC